MTAPHPFTEEAWEQIKAHSPSGAYMEARIRYMQSGSSRDLAAMAGCVSDTVPDLTTIGRDWEPPPEFAGRPHWTKADPL